MDIQKIRLILKSIDLGSITEAAEEMDYTTSGVSRNIAALENETGFPLLRRSRMGVEPTKECEQLIPIMRSISALYDNLEQTIDSINGLETGSLNIGVSYGKYNKWLSDLLAAFCRKHPGIMVTTQKGTSSDLNEKLENRELDFCIISERLGNHQWFTLSKDELVVLVPKNHPNVVSGTFPLDQLITEPYIDIYGGGETDNSLLLDKFDIKPATRFVCADETAAVPLIEAGLGICLINNLLAETVTGDFSVLPLDPPQFVKIGIAIPSIDTASPVVSEFIKYMKNHLAEVQAQE